MVLETPWGLADYQKQLAPGIVSIGTPSHGGIWLSDERIAAMPDEIRRIQTFAGGPWWEEDSDWALVALSFPDCFSGAQVHSAIRTARACHASKLDLAAYFATSRGRECVARAERWANEHRDHFQLTSWGLSGSATARRIGDGAVVELKGSRIGELESIFTMSSATGLGIVVHFASSAASGEPAAT